MAVDEGETGIYRARFRLRSATGTPWQADTLFGHLCWALRHRDGPEAVEGLLAEFESARLPFLLSNGFPGDLLPRPLSPSIGDAAADSLAARRAAARLGKASSAEEYLTLDEFNRTLRGEAFVPAPKDAEMRRSALKNQIDRTTGTTTGDGQLYEFDETYEPEVSVYVRARAEAVELVRGLLAEVADLGYGKRRSVGYGEVASFTWDSFAGFAAVPDANGWVSLANFVPARDDPRDGYWRTLVKYGRLGEEYAAGENPFKRPLVMLRAGSCLRGAVAPRGRLVRSVSPRRPEVAQYGLAWPVPLRLPAKD